MDVAHDLLDEDIAGLAAEIARRDQPRPHDLVLPAGEGLAVEQMVVQRPQADAVRVHHDAAVRVEDFPAQHVGDAIELAAIHGAHMVAIVPFQLVELGIAPDEESPVGLSLRQVSMQLSGRLLSSPTQMKCMSLGIIAYVLLRPIAVLRGR